MRKLIALLAGLLLLGTFAPAATAGWSYTFECADPSSSAPTVLCDVYLDPDFHNGSAGTVLFHATSAGKRTITVDAAGSHKLVVRGDSAALGGTNSSLLVLNLGAICQPGWASLGYQAWWADTGQDPDTESRHAHIDNLCWPVNNKIVNGLQTFSFQVQLHNQPPGARLTRVRVSDHWSGGSKNPRWSASTLPQPDANGNLVANYSVAINLSTLTTGRHEFRWGVYVTQPNGKVQLLSSRSEICIRSCSPSYRSLSSFPILQGNGAWYEKDGNPGYIDTRIRSTVPTS